MPRPHTPTPTPTRTAPAAASKPVQPVAAKAVSAAPVPAATTALSPKPPARVRRRGRVQLDSPASKPIAESSAKKPGTELAKPKAQERTPRKTGPSTGDTKHARSSKKARAGLSALEAAAKVLEGLKGKESEDGIQTNDLIGRMARTGLWTSPGGKTPASTLYAAMMREMKVKKAESRFVRVSPGHFAFKSGNAHRRGAAE